MVFVFIVSYHNYRLVETEHRQLLEKYEDLKEKIEHQKLLNQKLLEVIENEKLRSNDFSQTRQGADNEGPGTR
ncbi:heat-shock protein Hsp70 [Thermotoga sp. KOL6]|nr:heat-shock protein Hsp70 [Thermotoga sp. KOL6]